MTQPPDHAFFVLLAVLFPIRAVTFGYRRLSQAAEADVAAVRMWLYRQILALQWSLAALVVLLWVVFRRPWGDLGLEPVLTWGLIGVIVGMLVVGLLSALQQRGVAGREEAHARVRRHAAHLERMLPHTAGELRWFSAVAVTAGICEELIYRGYLLWYLGHWLPIVPAVAVASLIFGIGHFYQGLRGILITTVVGAFLAAVYLISGSLFAPIVIHALMDLYSGRVTYEAYRRGAPGA